MSAPYIRRTLSAFALGSLVLAGGCARVRDHKGYIVDTALIDTVKPGVDNRDSVTKTLGDPTFASAFDNGTDWYYLARDTRALAFANPRPVTQMLLTVRFDRAGNVTTVNKTGVETVVALSPAPGKTPTLGRNSSFFRDLFGNIGAVGQTQQGGGTADNPQ